MATITEQPARIHTLAALRSANFRLYFAGQLISISGTWMQTVAQGFLVFSITRSELWLGAVACAAGVPLVLFAPFAGVLVERFPRRRLMLFTQVIQMALAFVLAALTFAEMVQVWHIMVLAFILGTTNAIDAPARQTFVLEMVGKEDLHSGIALNSILNSSARVLGPTAAGLALVQFGPAWCFFINGVSFIAVLYSLMMMKVPYAITGHSNVSPLQQMREGLEYARHDRTIAPLLLLSSLTGLFAIPIIQLMPAFADVILHSPKQGYAALSASQGIGSVIGGMVVSVMAYRLGRGRVIALSVAGSALSIMLLAFQVTIPLAAFASGLTGLFLVIQVVNLNTFLQMAVPDALRGRILSLFTMSFLGFAPFGALALGGIAHAIGTAAAVGLYGLISGGLGALVLLRWRELVQRA